MTVSQRLSEYADILNKTGPDSPEGEEFIRRNNGDPEFVRLARLSASLKRAFATNRVKLKVPDDQI